MVATSPRPNGSEKKRWWLTNRKMVDKYIKDARNLVATQEQSEVASALSLLDAALALSPRLEKAMELKAKALLHLRRFKDVTDMLQDYIPSLKMANDDSGSLSSENSSQHFSRERVKLLGSGNLSSDSLGRDPSFKCFSVSDLKKKVMAGLYKNCDKDGQWRYLVLGQACCHLGLMEDAMALLQTGKRLATAAFRQESICWSDDSFSVSSTVTISTTTPPTTPPRDPTDLESINQLISHIKLLLRRKTAALAALDAGLYSEAIRHFSKIVDGRRGAPQGFLAECYMHRASAYRSAGRIAESIADCNRTLALDPTCIQALDTRASLLESIRCLPDCLHDLEHLKLLYNSILRDRKLPGPVWKRHNVRYREIPGKLCALTTKIQLLKQRVASGETGDVDYYALIGLLHAPSFCLDPIISKNFPYPSCLSASEARGFRTIILVCSKYVREDRGFGSLKQPAMQSQLVCSGCRSILLYPGGATNVCCALCNAITSVPPPGMEMTQLICGGCRTPLMYTRGAISVRCSCCHTVNLAPVSSQVAHVSCGNCRTTLMYPYGAPSVKCAVCHYVTNVGISNTRVPIPVHRPNGTANSGTVPFSSTSQTVVVENPMTVDESGKLVSSVVVGVTTDKK